eukprot:tig00020660_g12539.t1
MGCCQSDAAPSASDVRRPKDLSDPNAGVKEHLERVMLQKKWEENAAVEYMRQGREKEDAGDVEAALALYERALPLAQSGFGPDDANTGAVIEAVASCLQFLGQYRRALPLLERCLEIAEGRSAQAAAVPGRLLAIAAARRALGDYGGAMPLAERARELAGGYPGGGPASGPAVLEVAVLHTAAGRYERVPPLLKNLIQACDGQGKEGAIPGALARLALGRALYLGGDAAGARPLLEAAVASFEGGGAGPAGESRLAAALWALGRFLTEVGESERARAVLGRCLALREARLGPAHDRTAQALSALAACTPMPDDAPLFERALAAREAALGPEHPDVAETLHDWGAARAAAGDAAGARELLARALQMRGAALGVDHAEARRTAATLAALKLPTPADSDPPQAQAQH